jgi:phosphoglycolate phosphatase
MSTLQESTKAVLFDFDGTICDTFREDIMKVFYDTLPEKTKTIIPFENLQNLRDISVSELIQKSKLSKFEVLIFAYKFRNLFAKIQDKLATIKGMKEALEDIKSTGTQLFIVSSNRKASIEKFLKRNDIDLFDHIASEYKLDKKHVKISKIIANFKLSKYLTFYVGDEVRDIEAARGAGVKSIAVTWGMNSADALRKSNPDYIVSTPEELVKIFKP